MIQPESSPGSRFGRSVEPAPVARGPSVCPHCWMVNPGPFRLCGRCGAQMDTLLQESAGLRRTAPIQSPVPVAGARIGPLGRVVLGAFVILLALGYLVQLLPMPNDVVVGVPATAQP
jgi:hypothetical protein